MRTEDSLLPLRHHSTSTSILFSLYPYFPHSLHPPSACSLFFLLCTFSALCLLFLSVPSCMASSFPSTSPSSSSNLPALISPFFSPVPFPSLAYLPTTFPSCFSHLSIFFLLVSVPCLPSYLLSLLSLCLSAVLQLLIKWRHGGWLMMSSVSAVCWCQGMYETVY